MENITEDVKMGELKTKSGALRFDEEKLKYNLIEPFAMKELVKVYTQGAKKYEAWNYLKGMKWSRCIASLKRHIAAFEDGEDIDPDPSMLTYHMANAAWNCLTLLSYYKYHPELDDRLCRIMPQPKITVDLDDVCVKFIEGWCKLHNCEIPNSWQFDRAIKDKFKQMESGGKLNDFYLSLEPKIDPKDLTFEPLAYITARPVESAISEMWLDKHGFPAAPVYTVNIGGSKLDIIKGLGATIHIDDNYDTYNELNQNGICCYLMDALHNQKFNVGIRRLKSLKDLKI